MKVRCTSSSTWDATAAPDFDLRPPRERNLARYLFLDDAARELYADWADAARLVVATLTLYAGRHPQDPLLAELVGELSRRDADFRRWWSSHDVAADDPEQLLRVMTAEAGTLRR